MSKYYFNAEEVDAENCYGKQYWQEVADEEGKDIELYEAAPDYGTDYFYCSEYGVVGDKTGSDCGKSCEGYSPRNGKNGRCKHSKSCYTATDKKIIVHPNKKP